MQILLEDEQCDFILHFADADCGTDSAGVTVMDTWQHGLGVQQ
jgi:hypothetical protein